MAGYGQQLATELTTSVGGTLQINGSGWAPGEPVEVNVYSEPTFLGTVTASSTGTLDASFTLPVSVGAGSHTVVLTGTSITGEPATVRLALTVTGTSTPAASSPATALAFTG
jgi:hypothetical protein